MTNTTKISDHGRLWVSEHRHRCGQPRDSMTHFHPEHAAGEPGFPPGTILIRNMAQQREMEKHGQEMIDMFSAGGPRKTKNCGRRRLAAARQSKTMPNIFGDGGTPAIWLAVLDRVAALNAAHVLPDHSAPGAGSLVGAEHDLISEIRTRTHALKQQSASAADAGQQVSAELKTRHPDWPYTNAAGCVASVYAEPPIAIQSAGRAYG